MRILATLTGLVVIVAACATRSPSPAPDNVRGKDFASPPSGSLVVILPAPTTPELGSGENFMSAQLASQLKAAGFRVAMLDKASYEELWAQEVSAVGGVFDQATGAGKPQAYSQALSTLARRVCEETNCALLVQQRLTMRAAKLEGSVAEWDGQSRPVPLKNTGGDSFHFSGHTKGLSVELTALTRDGSLAFRRFGGATLPFETNIYESKNELRVNLFLDDKEIAEAVRIALEPLLMK